MANLTTIKELQQLLADLYALYLKTQNYHWHIKGANFKFLHEFFGELYASLADNIDEVAERIIILGGQAPATFKSFMSLTNISDGDSALTWQNMVSDLASDQDKIVNAVNNVISAANSENDQATLGMVTEYIASFEKNRWMLESHLS